MWTKGAMIANVMDIIMHNTSLKGMDVLVEGVTENKKSIIAFKVFLLVQK